MLVKTECGLERLSRVEASSPWLECKVHFCSSRKHTFRRAWAGRSQLLCCTTYAFIRLWLADQNFKPRKCYAKYTFAGPDRQLESRRKVAVSWLMLRAQKMRRVRELAHRNLFRVCAAHLRSARAQRNLHRALAHAEQLALSPWAEHLRGQTFTLGSQHRSFSVTEGCMNRDC